MDEDLREEQVVQRYTRAGGHSDWFQDIEKA
jgi:hypothetical protein